MGEFLEDCVEAVKYGFSWYKDMENWKSYGLYVVASFLLFGIIIALLWSLFAPYFSGHIPTNSPTASIGYLLFFLAGLMTAFVCFWIFQMYIIGGVLVRGLNGVKVASKPATFSKTNGAIILTLIQAFQTFFMWYDPKWLALLVVAIILPFIYMPLIFLSILLFLVYLCALFYMSIRLSMSFNVYFSTEGISYSHAIETSYALTKGMVTSMFGRVVLAGMVTGILVNAVTAIPSFIFWIIDSIIGFPIFQAIFNIIISPIQVFTGLYISAYVYSLLLGWNKARLGQIPGARMGSDGK
jgi:hypothetical protein